MAMMDAGAGAISACTHLTGYLVPAMLRKTDSKLCFCYAKTLGQGLNAAPDTRLGRSVRRCDLMEGRHGSADEGGA